MTRPTARRILLEQPRDAHQPLLMSERVSLGEGAKESWETITRVVKFDDDYYGTVEITRAMLMSFKRNFDANTYGQDIAIDVAHMHSDGAAAFVRELAIDKGRLRARLEWTEFGIDAVTKRGFRYLSADYHEDWKNPETGEKHGPLLFGAGLTVRPRVKGLDRIDPDPLRMSLSFDTEQPIAVAPRLRRILLSEAIDTMNKFLKQLSEALAKLNLDNVVVTQLCDGFEKAAKHLGEDETALANLVGTFTDTGKQLAEQLGGKPATINLSVAAPSAGALTTDDVKRLLAEAKQADDAAAKQLAETTQAKHKVFTDAINAAEGLDDDTKRQLCEQGVELIAPAMTDAQIRKFAEGQIGQANQLVAARELASMGYPMQGSARISGGEARTPLSLQESINQALARTDRGRSGRLRLSEEKKLDPFAQRVLAQFDLINADRIQAEHRVLASGAVGVADTNLPAGLQRTVIRESLSDLTILQVVQALVDPTAQMTTQIPYELRDVSQVVNDGIVYEGAGIPKAGVSQELDLAYIVAMKLSLNVTNEVMHFTRSSQINWDAWARNIESNARYIRELIAKRITNEWIRQADRYSATSVSAESITAQLTGSASTIKTAQFPIIRPRQIRDIKGTAIGSVQNPITLTVNGTVIAEWDGTGTQSAGTYYRITNANLGYIQLVSEAGTPVTPNGADAGVDTISYDYTTNVVKFDLDVPGTTTKERHLNGLLQAVGARKAVLAQDRFEVPDFALMSYTLNNTASDAENFESNSARADMGITGDGMMAPIKGLAPIATNGVSDLGEERILLAQRGMLSYVVAKPWTTGAPFEAVDSNGLPTGKKVAYGEEYDSIHVPEAIKGRATSVIAYSFTGR